MSRKTRNAQSRVTVFRHSAVLSLTAVLLRKLPNFVDDGDVTTDKKMGLERFRVAVAFLLSYVKCIEHKRVLLRHVIAIFNRVYHPLLRKKTETGIFLDCQDYSHNLSR